MAKEKIALCRMFSGEYWDDPNNIGYESINMFLPDGQGSEAESVSYMYLPANGDYDIKNTEIKYVLLTQHISKKFVEGTGNGKKNRTAKSIVKVIGLAKVEKEILKDNYRKIHPQDKNYEKYKCIGGGNEFDVMQEIISKNKNNEPLYSKAKLLADIHKKQKIFADEISYNEKKLTDLFKNNSSFGNLNILITLAVTGLSFPKRNIYLTNDQKLFSSFISPGDEVIEINVNPSSQKQTTFIDYNKEFIENILSVDREKAKELDISEFEKAFEPSFLTLIRKENDELSYSNLLAHFFSFPEFCKEFFKKLGINIDEIHQIDREEANIDILVKTSNATIVIENKINSALNGHSAEDVNGDNYRDQLVRYYEYVETKYNNSKYFIFAPDYNPVNQENFGSIQIGAGVTYMKDVWMVIRYSKILEFCDNYKGFERTNDEWYFKEFVKALKVHTVDSMQNHYRDMQIRMSKLF